MFILQDEILMPQRWKTVRIFISSTFRDMHAERDHLVRFIFPELKEKCRKNHVHLIDVDLRWGVTQADAQDGKALDICLDEIDSCRPYFLGLLAHRYGWVPPGEVHSITAQEIYHGVLHNEIPKQVVDLRKIIDGKLEGRALTQEQINCLVSCYPWDADKGKYLLRDDASDDEHEIIRVVFAQYGVYQRDRSFFFFRSEHLTKKLAGAEVEDYFEADKATQDKLAALKQEIINESLPFFEYEEIETFGVKVGETLWQRIEAELDEPIEEEKDWLEEEAEFHELFMADRTRRFVGRRDVLDRMHSFCEQHDEPSVMIITGEPGCGKSALMGYFIEEIIHDHPDWLIITHFIGASPGSTNLRQTLRRLCTYLSRVLESPKEVPEDIKELIQVFPDLLNKAAEERRTLIILDALNQFEKTDNAHAMRWLPQKLPENVRFVVSTLADESLEALFARRLKPKLEEVTGLDKYEIKELVVDYLKEIRHEFPNKQVEDTFFHKVMAGNPLYILVALEELRVFGDFEYLPRRIYTLPDNVPALFNQVLERIEADFNPELVRDCMSFIACGKQGMTAKELQTLLSAHAPMDAGTEHEKLPAMVWARLYRAFGAYLFERSGVIDFFHGQLKEAVVKRYLEEADRTATHKRIADYFEEHWREPYIRALEELPHQRTKARDWEGVERILYDFDFLQIKVRAIGPYPLIVDHEQALEAGCQVEGLQLVLEALRLSAHVLAGDPHQLAGQLIGRLLTYYPTSLKILIDQAMRWKGVPWLRPLNSRLIAPGEALECTLAGHTGSVLSLALIPDGNFAVSGGADGTLRIWDLERWEMLQTLFLPSRTGDKMSAVFRETTELGGFSAPMGLKKEVSAPTSMAVTPDGRYAVFSVLRDRAVWVWDIQEDKLVCTLEGHNSVVFTVAVTPDGKYAVSGGMDGALLVWSLDLIDEKRPRPVHIFTKHKDTVSAIEMTKDSRFAVSGSWDKTIRVWDIKNKKLVRTLHTGRPIHGLAIADDAQRIVSISRDKNVQIWALDQSVSWLKGMARKGVLNTLTDRIYMLAIAPDGRRIVAASEDKTLKVWDLERGECICRLAENLSDIVTKIVLTPDGHYALASSTNQTIGVWSLLARADVNFTPDHGKVVRAAAITPDGRRAVTGSWDSSIKVWDLKTQKVLHSLVGHKDGITTVAVTPKGEIAVSGSKDKTMRVWDLNKGTEIRCLKGYVGKINSVAVTGDGKYAVCSSDDRTIKIWGLEKGELLETYTVHKDSVGSVAMTMDGKRMLTTSLDQTIRIWDIGLGMRFLDDSNLNDKIDLIKEMISNSLNDALVDQKSSVRILGKDSSPILATAITQDGGFAVTGGADGTLRVWDLEMMKEIRTLKEGSKAVWSIAITPEGRPLLLATEGLSLNIWDMKKWAIMTTFTADSDFLCCAIARDGETLIAGDSRGQVHIFRLEGQE